MIKQRKSGELKWFARILSLLIVVAFFAVALPLAGAAQAQSCARNYTVESGDTLSSIALEFNTTVAELARLNNLVEPYTIFVNQSLCIPGTAATSTPTSSSSSGSKNTSGATNFSVIDNGKKVTLVVEDSPVRNAYFVRISERGFGTLWYKVGFLKTNKEGEALRTFRVPDELIDTDITVCLKDMHTNDVFCRNVFR